MLPDPLPRPRTTRFFGALLLLLALAAPVAAQQDDRVLPSPPAPPPAATENAGVDSDPTKPVLFSLRDEYFDLGGGAWQNVATLRVDRLLIPNTELAGRTRGILTRLDLPVVSFNAPDGTTTRGLGDVYAQAVFLPRLGENFILAAGTGLFAPTASDDRLGRGKWILAPAIAPVWRFPGQGLAFVKVQDWFSFAGDGDRPDVHYLTVTPTVLWRLSKRWWTLVDAESNTNWERNARTFGRGGLLFGYMVTPRLGLSLKYEAYFADPKAADWALKAVAFMTRF